jgi:hypothetical protein
VIVLPSMIKDLSQYREIDRMWNAASDALSEARSILVFGFSFPTSDALIGRMFSRAIAEGKKLETLAVVDIDPEAVLARIESLLPENCPDAVATVLKVPVDGSEPPWLMAHPSVGA